MGPTPCPMLPPARHSNPDARAESTPPESGDRDRHPLGGLPPIRPARRPDDPIRVEAIDDPSAPYQVRVETDRIRWHRHARATSAASRPARSSTTRPGARDLGFGLSIMDFLLEPAARPTPIPDGQYRLRRPGPRRPAQALRRGPANLHAGEGAAAEVIHGEASSRSDCVAGFTSPSRDRATRPARPGSRRSSSSRACATSSPPSGSPASTTSTTCSTASTCPATSSTRTATRFEQVYLSYLDKPIPAAAFKDDFAPDEKYLYQRERRKRPAADDPRLSGEAGRQAGAVAGGHDARPGGDVSEAWCHQRGYVCFIQELHGRPVKAGETFGAAYLVGWFDDIAAMEPPTTASGAGAGSPSRAHRPPDRLPRFETRGAHPGRIDLAAGPPGESPPR